MRLSLLLLLLVCLPVRAEDARLWLGSWNYDISGLVNNNGDTLDFDRDLDVQPRSRKLYGLVWNTAPGWWPDVTASFTPIQAGGRREVDSSTTFGPVVLSQGTSVVLADADLDDLDMTLRYPAKLGGNTVWAGIMIKRLNGLIVVRDESDTEEDRQPVDEVFPLLHLGLNIPVAGALEFNLRGEAVEYDGNKATEARAEALFKLGPFGLALGWQRKSYDLTSGSYQIDAVLQGNYFAVNALFK